MAQIHKIFHHNELQSAKRSTIIILVIFNAYQIHKYMDYGSGAHLSQEGALNSSLSIHVPIALQCYIWLF